MTEPATPPDPPRAAPIGELAKLIFAARRAAAQHRRRRHPNTRACGLCGWPWRTGQTRRGRPWRGCPPRREALEFLDEAGLLDADGRPTPPPAEPTGEPGDEASGTRPTPPPTGSAGHPKDHTNGTGSTTPTDGTTR